jgi:hypothetical protein
LERYEIILLEHKNVSELILTRIKGIINKKKGMINMLKDIYNFNNLTNEIERLYAEEKINDSEYNRFIEITETTKNECSEYLRKRSEVTNTDLEDELSIEEDYVATIVEEINTFLANEKGSNFNFK